MQRKVWEPAKEQDTKTDYNPVRFNNSGELHPSMKKHFDEIFKDHKPVGRIKE